MGFLSAFPFGACSLIPLGAVTGCPSRVRSTGEACLPLMGVLAWIRDQFSETGLRDYRHVASFPLVSEANHAPRISNEMLIGAEYPPSGGFRLFIIRICLDADSRARMRVGVNFVTYGVCYQLENCPQTIGIMRQTYPQGSERRESGFRKARIWVPKGANENRFLIARILGS